MSSRRTFIRNVAALPGLAIPLSKMLAASVPLSSMTGSTTPQQAQTLQIIEQGFIAHGQPGTRRACLTFPTITVLSDGRLLSTCRTATTKDSDDEIIELYESRDGGRVWEQRPFPTPTEANGKRGSTTICYLTEIEPRHLLAVVELVDRESHPGKPLFNPETDGCLPTWIVLADSWDLGQTWSPWRVVPMPAEIGPPSLTTAVMKLPNGTLALSIENDKTYEDRSKWFQKVVLFHSKDKGKTWGPPVVVGEDPTGRIFNWDQRAAVAPDGRIVAYAWTYDSETNTYLNIHRRISSDGGYAWSKAEDLGFKDQAAHPAIFPDGRIVLPYVDRFKTHSIRARWARDIADPLSPDTEVVIHKQSVAARQDSMKGSTSDSLADMTLWSYGLPFAEALPDGDALVAYYAGAPKAMDIHWARLRLPKPKR